MAVPAVHLGWILHNVGGGKDRQVGRNSGGGGRKDSLAVAIGKQSGGAAFVPPESRRQNDR